MTVQLYRKQCARCGVMMGPWPMRRCRRQQFCNMRCGQTQQHAPRSSRTRYVERLGQNPRLTTRQIGAMVSLSHGRVSAILRRKPICEGVARGSMGQA